MTNSPFEDPATSSNIEYQPLLGSLLMFEVIAHEEHIQTVFTPPGQKNPAVRVNMSVIDGPQAGKQFDDGLIFPKRLQAQLRPQVGKVVLGRLAQGEAKAGQNRPWLLQAATEEDKAKAADFLNRQRAGSFAAPSSAPSQSSQPPF